MLLPHIIEMPLSLVTILLVVSGLIFAIIAHQSRYTIVAKLFLVLHMILELPHMIEHIHIHIDGFGMILGHSLHGIFDIILLYNLSKSISSFVFFLMIIVILSLGMNTLLPYGIEETKPFVLGGVLGCIGIHFLSRKLHKKSAL
jgi:hypothetical protein